MPFTTERLVLRAYVEEDLDKVIQLMDDERLQPLLRIDSIAPMGPTWKDKMRKWFDEVCVFACIIEMKGTGEFMGYGGLKLPEPKNRDGTFAITLAPQFWGGGYGAETMRYIVDHGFRWYGLHRVSLGTFGSNERAIAMYSKVGFVEEGRGREAIWLDNKWVDGVSMGVLRREWAEKYWKSESGKDA